MTEHITNAQEGTPTPRCIFMVSAALFFLLLSWAAAGEECHFSVEPLYASDAWLRVDIQVEVPVFAGQEAFDLSSDRIAAFALGWRRWPGTPELRESDLLCYLPSTLDGPFKYIFFDRGCGNSVFRIQKNEVLRDGALFGLAVSGSEPEKSLEGSDPSLLRFLSIQDDIPVKVAENLASKCKNLNFLCLSVRTAKLLKTFLNVAPIIYYHICLVETGIRYWGNLHDRNLPLAVKGTTPLSEDLPEDNMPSVKYLFVDESNGSYGWKAQRFTGLEGLVIAQTKTPPEVWYWSIAGNKALRILVLSGWDFDSIPIPSNLLVSPILEHLHLLSMYIPGDLKIQSPVLRSASIRADSAYAAAHFSSKTLQFLSIRKLCAPEDLSVFPELTGLEIDDIAAPKPPVALRLRWFRCTRLVCSPVFLASLLKNVPNGTCNIVELTLTDDFRLGDPVFGDAPSVFRILDYRSGDKGAPQLLKAVAACKRVTVFSEDGFSADILAAMRAAPQVRTVLVGPSFIAKDRNIEETIPKQVVSVFSSIERGLLLGWSEASAFYVTSDWVEKYLVRVEGIHSEGYRLER